MTPAEKLLPRLDKVRQTKAGQWTALCAAHPDKTPSLRISEAEDGKLLLKCWAGCSAEAVVTAVGLEMRDLFPDGDKKPRRSGPSQAAIDHERMVLRIGQNHIAQGIQLSKEDQHRFELAQIRLTSIEQQS
jgi:hypothetical protein